MRALVVYESMFGNTRTIAEAIAEGLAAGGGGEVEAVEVGDAPSDIDGIDLVVVGGPTHAFSMSRAGTRESALKETDQPLVSSGAGIREWLDRLGRTGAGGCGATFDTKVAKPRLPGSAAAAAEKRLRRLGLRIVTPAETFLVDGMTGPLIEGEPERARRWGMQLEVGLVRTER
jgi:Flavodoxin domain